MRYPNKKANRNLRHSLPLLTVFGLGMALTVSWPGVVLASMACPPISVTIPLKHQAGWSDWITVPELERIDAIDTSGAHQHCQTERTLNQYRSQSCGNNNTGTATGPAASCDPEDMVPETGLVAQIPLFLTGAGLPPNILLVLDNSDSMQEGLSQGRVALEWGNPDCVPGPDLDPILCPAGARYTHSKSSIVKRVGVNLIDRYVGRINLGLMAYQQYEVSDTRNDVFSSHADPPRTVLWRLVHRPGDVRFSTNENPSFYDPDHQEAWDSPTKRFREPHPTLGGVWVFYNFAVPGYHRETSQSTGTPTTDATTFAHFRNFDTGFPYRIYYGMHASSGTYQDPDSSLYYTNDHGSNWRITLTDSMRQRGITHWGDRILFTQLNQLEWRANHSPGLGYLHVPIGGFDSEGEVDPAHWEAIRRKLEPQRHDWSPGDSNPLINPDWPLIAAGLTPLEGTIKTAGDYFTAAALTSGSTCTGSSFGTQQGCQAGLQLPESCGVNAVIWVTDGLPTVDAQGNELGQNPVTALQQARTAIENFYSTTEQNLGQPVRTYIIGFALPPGVSLIDGMPEDPLSFLAEAGGTERAFDARSEQDLDDAMSTVFDNILIRTTGSAAAVAANSAQLVHGTRIYQARFDSADWSGELLALDYDPTHIDGPLVLAWNAAHQIPGHEQRHIFTYRNDTGAAVAFEWESLSGAQQTAIGSEQVLDYIRGDDTYEERNGGAFRDRNVVLGDIVNSAPVYVSPYMMYRYTDQEYRDFLIDISSNPGVVYVGSNGGMLHAFHAETGDELFSFIPNTVLPNLHRLADPDYEHRFFVDGDITVSHAKINGQWRSVLVGGLGAGGKALYALDVTNPTTFTENDVLWEFSGSDDLGFTFGRPTIAPLSSGDFGVIFGNGYDSPNQNAVLYALDIADGSVIRKIVLDDEGDNGLSPPVAIQGDDYQISDVYAGDLKGNLWRVDLSDRVSDWRSYYTTGSGGNAVDVPLFTTPGNRPITSRIAIGKHRDEGYMLYFGSGKYFEINDNLIPPTPPQEAFFGVHDNNTRITNGVTDMLEQTVLWEGEYQGQYHRVTTDYTDMTGKRGWYINLPEDGERVVARALVRNNRVIFVTMTPNPDPCGIGGTSWVMELNALNGSRPHYGNADFDDILSLDLGTGGESDYTPSGTRSEVGMVDTPTIFTDGALEQRVLSGTTGDIQIMVMPSSGTAVNLDRESWRQIR